MQPKSNRYQDGVSREDLIKALYKLENKNIGAVKIDSSATNYFENLLPQPEKKKEATSGYSSVNRSEYLNRSEIITNIRQAATNIVHLMDKEYRSNRTQNLIQQPMNEQELYEEDSSYYKSKSCKMNSPGYLSSRAPRREDEGFRSMHSTSQKSPPQTYRNEVENIDSLPRNGKHKEEASNDDLENLYLLYFKKKPQVEQIIEKDDDDQKDEEDSFENNKDRTNQTNRMYTSVQMQQPNKRQPVEDRLLQSKANRDAKLKLLANKNLPTFKPQLSSKTKKSNQYY